ncbi:MAG: branched-chain-amino-acid transaminase [Anaerolineae bacterium]|nr:branched-chain-amino-acid transaminase [Phycisphaerae bacterium]
MAADRKRVDEAPPTTKKALQIWLDGHLVDKADAKVSVYDHGLLYGDGVFEGIRVYNGKIFECDAHVDRLYASAKSIRLDIPITKKAFVEAMEQTVAANGFTDCYIRAVVTRGVGDLGIDPKKSRKPSIFIIADTIAIYPKAMYEEGIATIVSSYIRNHPNSCSPRIKSLNYLNNILGKIEANDAGVPEAIMLNHMGNVSEATADNVFIVRNGTVLTPGTTEGILEGITRQVIIKLCRMLGIPCLETQIQRHDLYIADEMFLTGSGAEVMPVTTVDKRQIGNGKVGPLTKKLLEAFRQYIREY